jgi:hypothetical protein
VERIGVLRSTDGAATWTYLGHACFHAPRLTPVDPFPLLEAAKIVLYFYDITSGGGPAGGQPWTIHRTTSDNGLEFTVPTLAYSTRAGIVTDPAVVRLPSGVYRMYLVARQGTISASGSDGLTFTDDPGVRTDVGAVPGVLLLPDGRLRLFVCSEPGIVSLLSSDGLSFDLEEGVRIPQNRAVEIVCDPHPIRLRSGRHLMAFKVRPGGGDSPVRDGVHLAESADGLAWIPLGPPVAQGSVPGIVELQDGTLLLYYVDHSGAV